MGRVLDTLYAAVKEIVKSPSLFLCESYMMNIFDEYRRELPPFADYLRHTFKERRMMMRSTATGLRVAHLALAKKEIFRPKRKTNKESTAHMLDLVKIGMKRMKEEFEPEESYILQPIYFW